MKRAWTIINTGVAAPWLDAFGGRNQYGVLRSSIQASFISISINKANINMGHNTITMRGICDHWKSNKE